MRNEQASFMPDDMTAGLLLNLRAAENGDEIPSPHANSLPG
jgi:hypothetical protein